MISIQVDGDGIYSVCIQDGADLYQICHHGMTILQLAVRDNQESLVRFLLSEDVDPNYTPEESEYPLNIAIKNKNISIIQLLLQAKANVLTKDYRGKTSLDYAFETNDEIIQSIVQMAFIEQQLEVATSRLYLSRRLPAILEENFRCTVDHQP